MRTLENTDLIKQVVKQMVNDGELKIVVNDWGMVPSYRLVVTYDDQDKRFIINDRVISKKDEWKKEGLLGYED